MTNSPPPPVTPPPLAHDSNNPSRSPMSPSALGHSASEMLQHARGAPTPTSNSNSSSAGSFGRDYTFSHLHAQSGQVTEHSRAIESRPF